MVNSENLVPASNLIGPWEVKGERRMQRGIGDLKKKNDPIFPSRFFQTSLEATFVCEDLAEQPQCRPFA